MRTINVLEGQTISFTSTPPASAYVNGTYTPAATATSGLTVAFSIAPASSTVCSISGGVVTFKAAGSCVVQADQAGDATYNAAPQVTQTLTVVKRSQTVSFPSSPFLSIFARTTYSPSMQSSSGLPVILSASQSSASVCTVTNNDISIIGAGLCVVFADQPGNEEYAPAPQVTETITALKRDQTIRFTSSVGPQTVNGRYSPLARATSGLTAAFSIAPGSASVCSISGGTVTFHAVGSCVVQADQAGDNAFNAVPQATQTQIVSKAEQTVSFTSTAPASPKVNGTYTPAGTASSGLAPTFSIAPASSAVCSIAGSVVTFNAAGSCIVQGDQAGDDAFNAAPQVTQTLTVTKTDQTITFTSAAPTTPKVNDTYTPTATASSGLPVEFFISSGGCSISSGVVTFTSEGACSIGAQQLGDTAYNAAPPVSQTLNVTKRSQTVRFTDGPILTAGDTYTPGTQASSGLPVTITISRFSALVCSVSNNVITALAEGPCDVLANQPGNAEYAPAPQISQTLRVIKDSQTISFTSTPPAQAAINSTYRPTARTRGQRTGGTNLQVSISIAPASASVCSIANGVVTLDGAGSCVVQADQAGNTAYNPAPQVTQTITVIKTSQTVSFTSTPPASPKVNGTYTPAATATSALTVAFSIAPSSSAVCSIAGGLVTFNAAGSCVVQADQAGDNTFNIAPQATQTLSVSKTDQTISFTSTAPASPKVNGTYTPAATATSGLTVALSIAPASSAVCSIASGVVTFNAAGSCVVQADQPGNSAFNAAPQVTQSMSVTKSDQTITFTSTPPVAPKVGGTYTPAATATSTLTVAFSIASSSSAVCSIAGGMVTFNAVGSCVVQADQAGNGAFNAAPQVTQSMSVTKSDQTITFTSQPPAAPKVGGTYTPAATATSTLTVAFSIASSSSAVCSLSGGVVAFNAVGPCVVEANQAGDARFNAAAQAIQTINVEKAAPGVSLSASTPSAFFGAPVTLTATVSGGVSPSGAVTFRNGATVLGTSPLNGATASFTTSALPVGALSVTAAYNGDARNAAATSPALVVTINTRPDPSRERNVRSMVTTQISAAMRAAQAAVDAVNQRLLSLHEEDEDEYASQTPLAYAPNARQESPWSNARTGSNAAAAGFAQPALAGGNAAPAFATSQDGLARAQGAHWGVLNGDPFANREGIVSGARNELDVMAGAGAPPPAALMNAQNPLPERMLQQALPGQMLAYAPVGARQQTRGDGAQAVQMLTSGVPMGFQALDRSGLLPFNVWGAGYVGMGRLRADGSWDNRFNGAGMTIGADGKLTRDLKVGVALGLATSDTSIGADGSNSLMNTLTGTLYGSWRFMPRTFIDASVGGGVLTSDNQRFSGVGGVMLNGQRDGRLLFGSLGLTRVATWDRWKGTGYARFDVIHVGLGAYSETGSPIWALAFAKTSSTTTAGVIGARLSYGIPVSWGTFSPMARLEYRHVFDSGFSQALNYVDLAALPGYRVEGSALARSTMTGALGFRAEAMDGFMFELEYLLSASGERIEAHRLRAMARMKF